jgi:hypothetical protein
MKLTELNPDFERLVRQTPEGMAFWAGTGPAGKTCGACMHYGYLDDLGHHTNGCAIYYQQMHRHAARMLPKQTSACKYFERLTGS